MVLGRKSVWICGLAVALSGLMGCDDSSTDMTGAERREAYCEDEIRAYAHSKQFVRRAAEPSSVDLPSASDVSIRYAGDCHHVIVGHVDVENAFGGMVRRHFAMVMRYRPSRDSWFGSNVALVDQNTARQLGDRLLEEKTEEILERRTQLVQKLLQELGYNPGPVDGVMGPSTRAAIERFQDDVGIDAEPEPTRELVERLVLEDVKRSAEGE